MVTPERPRHGENTGDLHAGVEQIQGVGSVALAPDAVLAAAEPIIGSENKKCIVQNPLFFQLLHDTAHVVGHRLYGGVIAGKQVPEGQIFPVLVGQGQAVSNVVGHLDAPGASGVLRHVGEGAVLLVVADVFLRVLVYMGAVGGRCRSGSGRRACGSIRR